MVFGNELLTTTPSPKMMSFYAPSSVSNPSLSPSLITFHALLAVNPNGFIDSSVSVGQPVGLPLAPNFPEFIEEIEGDWTFRLDYNKLTHKYAGCGPTNDDGQMAEWGVCQEYSAGIGVKEIRKKLKELLEYGRETVEEQEKYAKDLADWESAKQQCESKTEDGFTFGYVNTDGTPTGYPDISTWNCVKTSVGTQGGASAAGASQEDTEEEEDGTEKDDEADVGGSSFTFGFSEGMKETLKNGLIIIVVLGVGYGAYQSEKKTHLFSNIYKKLSSKKKKGVVRKPPKRMKSSA